MTLTSLLQDKGQLEEIGGVSYLAKLAHAVPTAANVDYYAQIIEEKSMLRRLIRTATQIVSEGYTGGEDVSGMLSEAERRILEISNRRTGSGFIAIRDVLMEVFEKVEVLHQNRGIRQDSFRLCGSGQNDKRIPAQRLDYRGGSSFRR